MACSTVRGTSCEASPPAFSSARTRVEEISGMATAPSPYPPRRTVMMRASCSTRSKRLRILWFEPLEQIDGAPLTRLLLGARDASAGKLRGEALAELDPVVVRAHQRLRERVAFHRDQPELVDGLRGEDVGGGQQVPDVRRIEAAAEEGDLRHRGETSDDPARRLRAPRPREHRAAPRMRPDRPWSGTRRCR